MGNIPNEAGMSSGDHLVPNKKSNTPIFAKAGNPFINRKRQIKTTQRVEVRAQIKNMMCMTFSLKFCILNLLI
jgi:hypothetical protein